MASQTQSSFHIACQMEAFQRKSSRAKPNGRTWPIELYATVMTVCFLVYMGRSQHLTGKLPYVLRKQRRPCCRVLAGNASPAKVRERVARQWDDIITSNEMGVNLGIKQPRLDLRVTLGIKLGIKIGEAS